MELLAVDLLIVLGLESRASMWLELYSNLQFHPWVQLTGTYLFIPIASPLEYAHPSQATPALLAKATNMKVIGRAGVGIDNIDVAEATRKGVLVMNTPGGNTVSTAQLAISLLCSAAR